MRLTLTTFVTLDGVMQSPGAPEEDPRGGFRSGGWLPPHFDEAVGAFMSDVFDRADSFLLGRRTYEAMAGFWPTATGAEDRVARALNSLPKHVVTSTLEQFAWAGAVRVRGDLLDAVRQLKDQPGRELQIHGSGALARALVQRGVIDTYRVLVFPVVLGQGQRLFTQDGGPASLTLTDSQTSRSGVVMTTYESAGRPSFGSVLDEASAS